MNYNLLKLQVLLNAGEGKPGSTLLAYFQKATYGFDDDKLF